MYFCQDVDLLAWEPGIFLEAAFAHQALLKAAAGALSGTSLVMSSAALADVAAGMVAQITLADDSLTQLVEIVAVADATHATVSMLRGRAEEMAIAPLLSGSVKVSVVSFRAQIAAAGDGLLALVGVAGDRDSEPSAATADLRGFRIAAVLCTLAAVFLTLTTAQDVTAEVKEKRAFYEKLAGGARRTISAKVDEDGDGAAETIVRSGVQRLIRQ